MGDVGSDSSCGKKADSYLIQYHVVSCRATQWVVEVFPSSAVAAASSSIISLPARFIFRIYDLRLCWKRNNLSARAPSAGSIRRWWASNGETSLARPRSRSFWAGTNREERRETDESSREVGYIDSRLVPTVKYLILSRSLSA